MPYYPKRNKLPIVTPIAREFLIGTTSSIIHGDSTDAALIAGVGAGVQAAAQIAGDALSEKLKENLNQKMKRKKLIHVEAEQLTD